MRLSRMHIALFQFLRLLGLIRQLLLALLLPAPRLHHLGMTLSHEILQSNVEIPINLTNKLFMPMKVTPVATLKTRPGGFSGHSGRPAC